MRYAMPLAALAVFACATCRAAAADVDSVVRDTLTDVAIYAPPGELKRDQYLPQSRVWIEPGRILGDAVRDVGAVHFSRVHPVPSDADEHYGVLIALHPVWSGRPGVATLAMKYDAYGADGKKLYSGSNERVVVVGPAFNKAATTAARAAVNEALLDIRDHVHPDATRFPPTGSTRSIDPLLLVDHEKPKKTGTGFYINRTGQLLTARHVVQDCTLVEAHQDEATFIVKPHASNDLLDVSVLDSGKARRSSIPLRQAGEIVLGESVTSVGYPLHGLLGDSPNLTRGNVSALRGIRGSLGMFQFSAPIQPGNSGGPIVSDNGELLGMAVGTLSAEALAKLGVIPQNVNFALDARYLAMFLKNENVAFDVIHPTGDGGLQLANQAALSNTVQLNCYQ